MRGGLTEKPEVEKVLNFKFPDPGHLPPSVLAFHDVSFGYPNCEVVGYKPHKTTEMKVAV